MGPTTEKAHKHEQGLANELGCCPVLSAARSPGVIPSFPLACVCCFSFSALPCISTHRITNVINSQRALTTAEKGQWRKRQTNKETAERIDCVCVCVCVVLLKMMTAGGRKGNKLQGDKDKRKLTANVKK